MHMRRWMATALSGALMLSILPTAMAAAPEGVQAMTQERVDQANEAYNDVPAALEFISMSDTHVSSYEKWKNVFTNIKDWAVDNGFETDAVLVDGDVEANERLEYPDSSRDFYNAVIQLMDETFGKEMPILYAVGNHDRPGDYMIPMFSEAKADGRPNWYFEQADGGDYSNYHVEINGYDFISLDYRNYQSFLSQALEEISSAEDYDMGKPIFVQVHSGLNGTTWGGYQDIVGTAIQNALADYPQAIVFTAHSHYSNEAENGIYQDDFTVVNNGSMDYVELPSSLEPVLPPAQGKYEGDQLVEYERTCNFVSVLEDGTTVIRRFDATNERWMGMPWVIETQEGTDGFRYTSDQRSKVAPWFEEDAQISMSEVSETGATLTFTQAVDDELTEHYEISVKELLGNKDATYSVALTLFGGNEPKSYTGSFTVYSRFYLRPYPTEMTLLFSELKPGTLYQIQVTAVDNFGNQSTPQSITFQTAGEGADLPEGDYPALLAEAVEKAQALLEKAEAGTDGVYQITYPAATIQALKEKLSEVAAGQDAAEDLQRYIWISELESLMEQAEAGKEVSLDPPTVLPEGIWDGLQMDLQFEHDLTDGADSTAAVTTDDTISYESGVNNGTAVRLESGERIDLGARETLDQLGKDQDMTISFWYKPYTARADQTIMGNKSWSSATNAGVIFAYDYNDGTPDHISGSIGPGNGNYDQTAYIRFRDFDKNEWSMITLKVDRQAKTYTTYVNGIPYASGSLHENATLTSGSPFYIGGTDLDFGMDNLRIWNRALSDAEIAAVYGTDLKGESQPEENQISVSVSGPAQAGQNARVPYVFSAEGSDEGLKTIHLTFQVQGEGLFADAASLVAADPFTLLTYKKTAQEDGSLRYDAVLSYGLSDVQALAEQKDMMTLYIRTLESEGNLTVTLNEVKCNDGVQGQVNAQAAAVTTAVSNRYDVNGDGTLDINDIAAAQDFYQVREGDSGWDEAQKADVNQDGRVDLQDLVEIAGAYLDGMTVTA